MKSLISVNCDENIHDQNLLFEREIIWIFSQRFISHLKLRMISFVLSTEFKYNLVKVGVSKGDILSISLAWEGVEGKVYFK